MYPNLLITSQPANQMVDVNVTDFLDHCERALCAYSCTVYSNRTYFSNFHCKSFFCISYPALYDFPLDDDPCFIKWCLSFPLRKPGYLKFQLWLVNEQLQKHHSLLVGVCPMTNMEKIKNHIIFTKFKCHKKQLELASWRNFYGFTHICGAHQRFMPSYTELIPIHHPPLNINQITI